MFITKSTITSSKYDEKIVMKAVKNFFKFYYVWSKYYGECNTRYTWNAYKRISINVALKLILQRIDKKYINGDSVLIQMKES